MKFDKWFEAAKRCPDKLVDFKGYKYPRLVLDFTQSNWSILLDEEPEVIAERLEKLEGVCKNQRDWSSPSDFWGYFEVPELPFHLHQHNKGRFCLINKYDAQKQDSYRTLIIFPGTRWDKVFRELELTGRICNEIARASGIGFCLPRSYGTKGHKYGKNGLYLKACDRIVYWPDEIDAEMFRLRRTKSRRQK